MGAVKTLSPRDGLQEGFDLAAPTHIGPDGGPVMAPPVTRSPPRPSLCSAGPCVNYHRLEIQVEAEDPKAQLVPIRLPAGTPRTEAVPLGTLVHHPATFHTAVHHYCYPSPGIEIELGDVPVVTCNLHRGGSLEDLEKYLLAVAEWEAARAREAEQAAAAERVIAEGLAAQEAARAREAEEAARTQPHAHTLLRCMNCRLFWCEGCPDPGLATGVEFMSQHPNSKGSVASKWQAHAHDCMTRKDDK